MIINTENTIRAIFLAILVIYYCDCATIIKERGFHFTENVTEHRKLKAEKFTNEDCKSKKCLIVAGIPSRIKTFKSNMDNILIKYIFSRIPLHSWQEMTEEILYSEFGNEAYKSSNVKQPEIKHTRLGDNDSEVTRIYLIAYGEAVFDLKSYTYLSGFNTGELNSSDFRYSSVNGSLAHTENIFEEEFPKIIPDCQVGNENCTRCQEISRFCHFMFSEGRCVFYNSEHASEFYECGVRWFPIDKNEVLFGTFALLLIFSIAVWAFLCWKGFATVVLEAAALDEEEANLVQRRAEVQRIREKWLQSSENNQESSNENSTS